MEQLINVALADLKRIGVHSSYLDPENITDPLIIEAALVYAKANFGNRKPRRVNGGVWHDLYENQRGRLP